MTFPRYAQSASTLALRCSRASPQFQRLEGIMQPVSPAPAADDATHTNTHAHTHLLSSFAHALLTHTPLGNILHLAACPCAGYNFVSYSANRAAGLPVDEERRYEQLFTPRQVSCHGQGARSPCLFPQPPRTSRFAKECGWVSLGALFPPPLLLGLAHLTCALLRRHGGYQGPIMDSPFTPRHGANPELPCNVGGGAGPPTL